MWGGGGGSSNSTAGLKLDFTNGIETSEILY